MKSRQHHLLIIVSLCVCGPLLSAMSAVPPRLGNPISVLAAAGEAVTLSANGGGTPPVTNQWFFEGALQPIQTNLLLLPSIDLSQAGKYRAEVGNVAGSATQEWQIAVAAPMPVAWTWTNSAISRAESANIALDGQGNAFVTCSMSNQSSITAKIGPTGVRNWAWPGGGDAIKLDGIGNLYVAGRSILSSVYVLKYSVDGVPSWNEAPSIPVTGARSVQLTLARDGGCFVGATGRISTNAIDSIVISRIGPDGSKLWQTEISTNAVFGASVSDMDTLSNGSLAVVGSLGTNGLVMVINEDGTVAWQDLVDTRDSEGLVGNPMSHVASEGEGGFVVAATTPMVSSANQALVGKYSGAGAKLWFHRFPKNAFGSNGRLTSGLAVDKDRNVILALTYGSDVFLKLTADGVPVWTNHYSGWNFRGTMRLDANGNIHVVGGGTDLGYYFDFAAVKYDPTGRLLGLSRYRGTSLDAFNPLSFAPDVDGSMYIAGKFGGQLHVMKLGLRSVPTLLSVTHAAQPNDFTLELSGEPGFSYTIQSSDSLDAWHDWTNSPNVSGTVKFNERSGSPARFFRAFRNP